MTMNNFAAKFIIVLSFLLTFDLTLAQKIFQFSKAETLDNVLFPENVLFDRGVRSKLECVRSCSQTSGCFFLTFYGGNRCRGHNVAASSPAAGTTTPGARAYIADNWLSFPCAEVSDCPTLEDKVQCNQGRCQCDASSPYMYTATNRSCTERPDWLDEPCSSDSDCPTTIINNVQCFEGLCICVPGYYYSVSTRLCISDCPENDLQADFTRYPTGVMWGNNYLTLMGVLTWSDCENECVTYNCRSLDFGASQSACWLQMVTALDVPNDWAAGSIYYYSQRKCA